MSPLLVALASAAEPAADVVWARPFEVAEPYAWTMRGDRPTVSNGWIVQFRVEPSRVPASQAKAPILFADDMPVRPINLGAPDGCLVAVVAGAAPLDATVLFWSAPDLPERFDAARAAAARDAARDAGQAGVDARAWVSALAAGDGLLRARDEAAVMAIAQQRAAVCATPR